MAGTFKYKAGTRPQSEEVPQQRVQTNKKRSKSDSRNKRVNKVRAGNVRVSMNQGHQHTAVRPHDQSVLAMDSVLWSDKHYTVPQLVLEYGPKLPSIVKVTRGYHDDAVDISVNEVLLVQNYARQKRINVITADDKEMSIPVDSPLDVFIPSLGKELKIGECCSMIPIKASICKPRELESDSDTLRLKSVSHETFLRCSKIIDGWIDQRDVFEIPSLFNIEFAVAEGISGATKADWNDYKLMYEYSVRHVNFNTKGYQDVFIFGESRRISLLKPQSLFDRPDSQDSTIQDDVVYSLDVSLRPSSVSPRIPGVEEEAGDGEVSGEHLPPIANRRVQVDVERCGHSLDLNSSLASSSHLNDGDDAGRSSRLQETPAKVGCHSRVSHQVAPTPRQFTSSTTTSPSPRPLTYTPFSQQLHVDTGSDDLLKPPTPLTSAGQLLTPCSDVTSNGDLDDMFNEVIESAEIDASQEIIFDGNESLDRLDAIRLQNNEKSLSLQEDIPLLETSHGSGKLGGFKDQPGVENKGFTPSPIAIVKPQKVIPDHQLTNDAINRELFVSLRAMNKHAINNCTRPLTSDCRFTSLTQVPEDLSTLSRDEVQKCLELMMVKDRHRLHDVDGKCLTTLSDKQLAEEPYKLTPFDCSKIMRFARGWRP